MQIKERRRSVGLALIGLMVAGACGLGTPDAGLPTRPPLERDRDDRSSEADVTPTLEPIDTMLTIVADSAATVEVEEEVAVEVVEEIPVEAATEAPVEVAVEIFSAGPFESVVPVDLALAGELRGMQAIGDGMVWIFSGEEAVRIRGNEWETLGRDPEDTIAGFDGERRVWIVAENGTHINGWVGYYFDIFAEPEGWTPLPVDDIWWRPVVLGMHPDELGRLWLATGVDIRVLVNSWSVFTPEDMGMEAREPSDVQTAFEITMANDGAEVWVGECDYSGPGPGQGLGARWFEGVVWRGSDSPVATGCVGAIREDGAGRVWVGMKDEVWIFDRDAEEWSSLTPPDPPEGQHYGEVLDIVFAPSGDAWVSLSICGGASCSGPMVLYLVRGETWTQVGDLTDIYVGDQRVVLDADGTAWLF
jgi:hypothetical protein